jgi:AcrR family transcriptional regulator
MSSSETTQQILNAAGEVFAEKGFKQATVREICAKAGVNLAAVNYHFGDKERLYIAAVKNARNVLEANVPLPSHVDVVDPEDALRVMIQTLARRILNREVESWQHGLLVREFMNPSRACEEIMQESIKPFMEKLQAVIRKLMPPDVPEHTIRQLGFSIVAQCAYYRLQERVVAMLTPAEEFELRFTPDTLADHITRFSIAAIRSYTSIDSCCET